MTKFITENWVTILIILGIIVTIIILFRSLIGEILEFLVDMLTSFID
jgi:hypothetical protein